LHQQLHLTPGLHDSEAATPLPSARLAFLCWMKFVSRGTGVGQIGCICPRRKIRISWYKNLSICFVRTVSPQPIRVRHTSLLTPFTIAMRGKDGEELQGLMAVFGFFFVIIGLAAVTALGITAAGLAAAAFISFIFLYAVSPHKFVDNNVFRDALGEHVLFPCIRSNWKKNCKYYASPETYHYWEACVKEKWMMFLILSLNFVVYLPILMLVDILYMLIIYPPRWVYHSFRKRRQRVEEKDQERKRKFPVSHLQNGLSELARRGFNDRDVNAVLLEQYDYKMEKVLDRLSDPTSDAHYKNNFGRVKVHNFDEDNLEAIWEMARKGAAHRTPYHGKNYKAPAGLAYDASQATRLVVGVQSKLQSDLSRFVLGVPRTAFRANGALPAGFSIDESTGDIHGTPTEPVSAFHVTVTAFNGSGECSTIVNITVTAERAPEGLSYDTQATSDLIVNVQKKISPEAGFCLGLPAAKFQVINAALPAATSLESVLNTATSVPLARDTKHFADLFALIVVSASEIMSMMSKVGQMQGGVLKLLPLSNDLDIQSLETIETVITDLMSQEKAAADGRKYPEAIALQQKIEQKTEELSRYQHFKRDFLDPLRGCCNEMTKEADKLGELVKQAKTIQTLIQTRGQELNEVFSAVAHELVKTSELADGELAWLQERELSGLNSTSSSASQEVTKKQQEFKSRFTDSMQQVCDLVKQVEQYQQTSHTQLRAMQELVCDTSSKPLVIQKNLRNLVSRNHVAQMQKMIDNSPKGKIIELEQMIESFLGTLKTLVSPCVHLLSKAPAMQEGATLDEVTGEIMVTLSAPDSNHVFKVRAFNDTGECSAKVVLSGKAQAAPSGLRYTDLPDVSEYDHPTQSNGLLLTGDEVCLKCSHTSADLPASTFTVSPHLPSGLSLNAQTGHIIGTPPVTHRERTTG
jgi:hypothetical protein